MLFHCFYISLQWALENELYLLYGRTFEAPDGKHVWHLLEKNVWKWRHLHLVCTSKQLPMIFPFIWSMLMLQSVLVYFLVLLHMFACANSLENLSLHRLIMEQIEAHLIHVWSLIKNRFVSACLSQKNLDVSIQINSRKFILFIISLFAFIREEEKFTFFYHEVHYIIFGDRCY
jgi:hypothetical protein